MQDCRYSFTAKSPTHKEVSSKLARAALSVAAIASVAAVAPAHGATVTTINFSGDVLAPSVSDTRGNNIFGATGATSGEVTGSVSFDQTAYNARGSSGASLGTDGGLNSTSNPNDQLPSVISISLQDDPTLALNLSVNGVSTFNHNDAVSAPGNGGGLVAFFARTPTLDTVETTIRGRTFLETVVVDFTDDFFFVGFDLSLEGTGRTLPGGGSEEFTFDQNSPNVFSSRIGVLDNGELVRGDISASYVREGTGSGGAIATLENADIEVAFAENIRQDLLLSPEGIPAAVPIPAALPLLASGLALLGFAGRRRKRLAEAA